MLGDPKFKEEETISLAEGKGIACTFSPSRNTYTCHEVKIASGLVHASRKIGRVDMIHSTGVETRNGKDQGVDSYDLVLVGSGQNCLYGTIDDNAGAWRDGATFLRCD